MSEESQDPKLVEEEEPEEEPAELPEAEPEAKEDLPVKKGRPKLSEEDKKERRRETQKTYYSKIRAKVTAPEPPPAPLPPVPEAPPVPVPKPAIKRAPKKAVVPRQVHYEPTSPRSTMIAAYREARIHQSNRKQALYASWLE